MARGDAMQYLDGFKPARSILVVVDNGLVLICHFTTSTFTDHVLCHKTNHTAGFILRVDLVTDDILAILLCGVVVTALDLQLTATAY